MSENPANPNDPTVPRFSGPKRNPKAKKDLYGLSFPALMDNIAIELYMIQKGCQWKGKQGQTIGMGAFFHYRRLQQLLWPKDVHHRWSDLMLEEILKNTITAIMGPKDSGKTHVALTRYALTDYFSHPQDTLIMISSTDVRGLELRVWGDMKTMFNQAKERYPSLPGHLIDSKHAVATDNLIEDGTRDLRRGIICLPAFSSGGTWQGLGKYVGIKQKRRRLLGDEVSIMKAGFLDALANLNSGNQEGNEFKGVFVGNPLGIGDPLDRIAEPKNGWGTEGEITETTTWDNRFENGRTICLYGLNSPNFDFPADEPVKYPWMINRKSIESVAAFYGKDSLQYWSQCKGVRKAGLNGRRVFTRNLAIKFKAFEEVAWKNDLQTRIYAVDAAYGEVGGDRCVGGWGSFGRDVNGDMILHMNPHVIIPVKAGTDTSAEDQIAEFVRQDCISLKIPAENVFYDATGRGSLGTAFARIWSPFVNPVEFGGRATNRQVSAELMIIDPETQKMRPKTCYEHFSKFVTELWFMARYVIESGQMRGLTEEVLEDGSTREWKMVTGNRIEIEAKIDTKERMGRSPDLMDWWVTVVEGARQKGFQLRALAAPQKPQNDDWKDTLRKKAMDLHHAGALNYSA